MIANPIYDVVFKYMMNDQRVSRTVLSAPLTATHAWNERGGRVLQRDREARDGNPLLDGGMTPQDIATRLGVSPETVKRMI